MVKQCLILAATVAVFFACAGNASASAESRAAFTAQATWFWGEDTSRILIVFDRWDEGMCDPGVVGYAGVPDTEVHFCLREWRKMTVAERCHGWIHEVGHALGHEHARHGVMAPFLLRPIAACRWWAKHGAASMLDV